MPHPIMEFRTKLSSKRIVLYGGVFLVTLLLLVLVFANRYATFWINGPGFQAMLDKETSKGLKLQGSFSGIHRTSLFGLTADAFGGVNGYKTMVTLQAQRASGTFNPLGIILRRWEIDSLHIDSGTVMLQKSEPTPGAPKGAPWPPWWALFWPYRVYLADIKVDNANILFKLQDKESGIYATRLEITPNGRDFEYDAQGGQFKTPMSPPLAVTHVHLLIRKPRLYCSDFRLSDDPAHPAQGLHLEGDAGLQDDRSIHLKVDLNSLQISPWLPEKLRSHVEGEANGHLDYTSSGTGLQTGSGGGKVSLVNGVLRELKPVHQYVTLTGSPDPGNMVLKVCQADLAYQNGGMSAQNIEVECAGVFRLTGNLKVSQEKNLSGDVELGLTSPYLSWLPTARTAIFTRDEGPYHFTAIHFSGTTEKPEQDLSQRVMHEVGKSPLLAVKLLLNQAGSWFDLK